MEINKGVYNLLFHQVGLEPHRHISSSFDFIEDKARVSPIWEKPVDTYYVYQKK